MTANAIPVKGKPGTIYVPAIGKEITQIDSREDDVFDSVGFASGAITAGREYKFFDVTSDKNEQHTNVTKTHKILGGHELSLTRIGLLVRSSTGDAGALGAADVKRIYDNAAFEAQIGKRDIGEGPAIKFQSGYGVSGNSSENATAIVSNGVPSGAAAPSLLVQQDVTDDDDIYSRLFFPDAAWLTAAYWGTVYAMPTIALRGVVTCFWHGIIRKPLGR